MLLTPIGHSFATAKHAVRTANELMVTAIMMEEFSARLAVF